MEQENSRRHFIKQTLVTSSLAFLTGNLAAEVFRPKGILTSHREGANDTVALLKEFTDNYRSNRNNKYLCEALCLEVQWKNMMCDIKAGDLFAGRAHQPMIGFTPQSDEDALGYYLHTLAVDHFKKNNSLSYEDMRTLDEMVTFWKVENTADRTRRAYTPLMKEALLSDLYYKESGIAFTLWRMSGVQLDFAKLIRLGIPGLRKEITSKKNKVAKSTDAWKLYQAMLICLDTFCTVSRYYSEQAQQKAKIADDPKEAADLIEMARILDRLPENPPETFREGIQLLFLYVMIDGAKNYGRMDDALGELYCRDIDRKMIDEEEAIRLLTGLWHLIIDRNYRYDSRIILGGLGRINEPLADRLALVMMETSRRVKDIVPQLALRFHKNQDPRLYQKALDIIGEGNPYPMLYNDEVNIPSVQKAFNIPYQDAIHAIQFSCGEYVMNHRSVDTPSAVINLLAALNVTLHKGIDPVTGKPIGMPMDRYAKYGDFETFEQLWGAYKEQIEYHVVPLAQHEKLEYDVTADHAAFLFSSILMDDCIERGKGIFEGGIRYLDGCLESYGNSNTADSLTAIKQLVYQEKRFTLNQIVEMLDKNFEGFEKERKMLLDCPKYGNDNEIADAMLVNVHDHLCHFTRNQAARVGLHAYLIVIINNDANTVIGEFTSASADGRKAFTYMNPGNAPVGGADKSGVTAFLNSIVKPATDIHAGAVQNMKFSKEMFTDYRDKFEILMETYWQMGGAQAMITVISRGDLEAAMEHPELYQNLIVRVGGFSERFVNLPRHTQLEILSRTLY
jgi:pyruvate-formate lyase